jgi:ribosomal protein L40E
MGNFSTTRALLFSVLSAKGYKVQQDLNTRIIANHSFSATNYPHGVQVDLDFTQQGHGKIILRIDHAASAVYVDRLVQELRGVRNIDNLGLLEGEETKLKYPCSRVTISSPSMWDGKVRQEFKKGLLVFTTDNMIFMQQEGGSDFAQALRFPLESISGLVTGGTLIKNIRIAVGVGGSSEQHEFAGFQSVITRQQQIQDVRAEIERLLKVSREEKKRLAVEAMAKGTVPTMVFCRFCGARNKSDTSNCANCGAVLT